MSGGHFDYQQHRIQDIIDSIEHVIRNNENSDTNEYGETIGEFFSEKTINEFKTALTHLKKAYTYSHRIDWLLSGDDSEETFHERLQEELKEIL